MVHISPSIKFIDALWTESMQWFGVFIWASPKGVAYWCSSQLCLVGFTSWRTHSIRWLRCTPAISGWLKHWEHLGFQLLGFMCYNFLTWIYFYYLLFLGASSHTPGTWWFKPFLIWSLAPWLLPLRPIKWPFGWESMHPYRGNGPGFGQRLLLSLLWIWGQWLLKNDLVARLWQPATKIPKVERDSKGTNLENKPVPFLDQNVCSIWFVFPKVFHQLWDYVNLLPILLSLQPCC